MIRALKTTWRPNESGPCLLRRFKRYIDWLMIERTWSTCTENVIWLVNQTPNNLTLFSCSIPQIAGGRTKDLHLFLHKIIYLDLDVFIVSTLVIKTFKKVLRPRPRLLAKVLRSRPRLWPKISRPRPRLYAKVSRSRARPYRKVPRATVNNKKCQVGLQ